MEMEKSAAVIEDLVETLEDGAKGFEQAAELLADGENAGDLASEMRALASERRQMSGEMRDMAASLGHDIDEEGSAGGAIHRAWMSLKDAMTGTDPHAVLATAEEGEDHAVSEYEDALAKDDLTPALRALIERQAQAVKRAHDKVRALRDRFDD
jgi:uncharacterized protein (TIGR02284 family)